MTMTYYDGEKILWRVRGVRGIVSVRLTEEEAEGFMDDNPQASLDADFDIPSPLPDEAADDYLECSCPPDPPTANSTATLCKSCRAYFASLEN
jgi:hypothetical protein